MMGGTLYQWQGNLGEVDKSLKSSKSVETILRHTNFSTVSFTVRMSYDAS
jgi:hypothetical protein